MADAPLNEPRRPKVAARVISLYLPQFHPIPENDVWWGKGFTEWTNTAKAKPLYRGHYQPHVPADLGFYDLRVAETRQAQADMARGSGHEAFCYYHYWFGGKRILERPFNEVLESGQPDFPFCICWANESWTGVWHGAPKRILIEQTYPGEADHRAHFHTLLPAFQDRRYVRVEGRPLFLIYQPRLIPDIRRALDLWRTLAARAGLPGLFIVGFAYNDPGFSPDAFGLDGGLMVHMPARRGDIWVSKKQPIKKLKSYLADKRGLPTVYAFEKLNGFFVRPELIDPRRFPCLIPNWDNTPRSGSRGLVLHGSTPELFRLQVRQALEATRSLPAERRLLFIKSWNEWAEGNHLEPDLVHGCGYLDALRSEIEADARIMAAASGGAAVA
jgi:hypothetical protein